MALIICPECKAEVSDQAVVCPKCGFPISKREVHTIEEGPVRTIQETSKKYKLQLIACYALLFLGGILTLMALVRGNDPLAIMGIVIASIGLISLVVTRFQIWWNHK